MYWYFITYKVYLPTSIINGFIYANLDLCVQFLMCHTFTPTTCVARKCVDSFCKSFFQFFYSVAQIYLVEQSEEIIYDLCINSCSHVSCLYSSYVCVCVFTYRMRIFQQKIHTLGHGTLFLFLSYSAKIRMHYAFCTECWFFFV